MEEEYDAIVCGTGLIECVLSGLLSVNGHKVLHLDRNKYYGGESASLNLEQLYANFGSGPPPESLGKAHMYNVDMIPKFLMADGELVKILRATVVNRYQMEFMLCNGSFVAKGSNVYKVPCTEKEALSSSLMGILEKRRAAKFFAWAQDYKRDDPKTWGKLKPMEMTMKQVFDHFGLSKDTIEFIGHAIALEENEDYLSRRAHETIAKIELYETSLSMYEGGTVSPFVYPLYGLGELPQVFARLSAVYGGTYMLDTPVEKMQFSEDGVFQGVHAGGQFAKAKFVVGDPTYFPDKVKQIGQVARCICLLERPLDCTKTQSCQIIIPYSQCKPPRKHDIYVVQLSEVHKVVPKGKYLAIVSTFSETGVTGEAELKPGLDLLGKNNIIEKFVSMSPLYQPTDDGAHSKAYISESYDSSSHFEGAARNILELYEKITGKPYDFDKSVAQPVTM